ncbi:MAG: ABC transporter substrate-binding protein [Bacteroidetes bacterium]|nr:MAG: ABC transporter substrate-binding protein [Bacteroidota bacterium]
MKRFFTTCLLVLIALPALAQKIFRYNQTGGITSLDPAYANIRSNVWATTQLYNGLFSLNKTLEAKQELAESWAVSEDGLVCTVHIRKNVHFHDSPCFPKGKGRELTAKDFVYSFQRLFREGTGAWVLRDKVLAKPDGSPADTCFKALNKYTLRIYLKKRCPQLPFLLATPYCFVVPQEAVEHYGNDFGKNPVGTGAFRFEAWVLGQKLTFAKHERYWERDYKGKLLPYLDGIEITTMDNRNTEFLEFTNGNLHLVMSIAESSRDQILNKDGSFRERFAEKYQAQKMPYLNTEYVGFYVGKDAENTPLQNVKVRQALSYAINKKELVAFLRNNVGKPAEYGFAPPSLPSFDSTKIEGYAYNLKKALALLNEAGFAEGKGLPTFVLATYPSDKEIAEYLQKAWATIGVKVQININQFATHRRLVGEGKAHIFRGSWIADYPDAENYLALGYGKHFSPTGPNFFHFKNNEYDALFEEASNSQNLFTRYENYAKMDNALMQNAVLIPLYYDEAIHITQKNIENLEINAMNSLVLKYADMVEVRKKDKKKK